MVRVSPRQPRPARARRRGGPSAARRRARVRLAVVLAALLIAALIVIWTRGGGSPVSANHRLESIFQDDDHLVYAPTSTVVSTLDTLHALGADRVRVTVLWSAVAPASASTSRPAGF